MIIVFVRCWNFLRLGSCGCLRYQFLIGVSWRLEVQLAWGCHDLPDWDNLVFGPSCCILVIYCCLLVCHLLDANYYNWLIYCCLLIICFVKSISQYSRLNYYTKSMKGKQWIAKTSTVLRLQYPGRAYWALSSTFWFSPLFRFSRVFRPVLGRWFFLFLLLLWIGVAATVK